MQSIIGFTVFSNLPESRLQALENAHQRALTYFMRLQRRSLVVGETHLELWGREGMENRLHTLPDGSLLALIGSPRGEVNLAKVQDALMTDRFELPWEGRFLLLRISADGKRWTMWNDWLGSMPVFHAEIGRGRIASTLEPAVVASAGYTPDDFYLPGLVSLLINGHYLADWTLYKGMKVVPPDSRMEWGEGGFRAETLWTVAPSQSRWEAGWDDLVDEMYELSRKAIADVLKTQPRWILPLSSGLDSRLIAGVAAEMGVELHTYAWGEPESTDVIYSRQTAKTLGLPWKWIDLCNDFLERYTPLWADLFGSSMHFHGMYQMCFLDSLPDAGIPLLNGFLGDVLSGSSLLKLSNENIFYKKDWYLHWSVEELRSLLKAFPLEDILLEIKKEVQGMFARIPGAQFSRIILFELWNRQRLFTSFQATLASYWIGVDTPFLNRAYARFSLSLPRAVLENRRLLGDVFRRYYGKLAVIPGTYANEPFIRTGRYILRRRIVEHLPPPLHHGPFAGFDDVPLRMDIDCIQASGKKSLWPLFDAWNELAKWLDVRLLEREYQTLQHSNKDIRPLRRLQSVQTLAYRLRSDAKVSQA
ncbi:MAG: asparagine synthase-related protein [Chloroflexota bacterium]